MKIKVYFDYEESDTKIYSLEEFVSKFNRAEINSNTDYIELLLED